MCDRTRRVYPRSGLAFLVLLSIVMPIVLAIIAGQSKDSRNTMNDAGVQKRKGTAPLPEPGLTLVPQSVNAPDPRLIEFVRLLARNAARRWYEQSDKEQGSKRS